MSHLQRLWGTSFMLSIPPGELAPPRTVFVWVCCHCGRSHQQYPVPLHRPPTPPTPPPSGLRRPSFRGRFLGSLRKEKQEESEVPIKDLITSHAPGAQSEERRAYRVKFTESWCKCGHNACVICLLVKVEWEEEWVSIVA